jgi:hypothetical protein
MKKMPHEAPAAADLIQDIRSVTVHDLVPDIPLTAVFCPACVPTGSVMDGNSHSSSHFRPQ